MRKKLIVMLALAAGLAGQAGAETIRIIAPYAGSVTNEYSNPAYHLNLRDTAGMQGLYAQWINTKKFQANAFYYRAPDVNYSRVTGLHLNFDYYLKPSKAGKWTVGAGLEDLRIAMSAGAAIAGLDSFDMANRVRFCYLRAGRYFYFRKGVVNTSLMPYGGYAREKVSGDIRMDVTGPTSPMTVGINDSDTQPMAGLNLNANLAHFLDVQAKWLGRFKDDGALNEYSLMANIYLTRHWGVSYRYKYMEYGSSSNSYNLAGLIFAF